ncbi:MAG: hypothetical protein LUG99_08835 [Lachnospiraceae bacterium]|nr:hypothetical protein [Lachnospiraceae bacterium]
MPRKVLETKGGEMITWNEAIARALKGIGHPVRAKEIKAYLPEHVIVEYPGSAKTPVYTIYRELYTHSRDSVAGRDNTHMFYSEERGLWGLANSALWRKHRSDKKCDPEVLRILGQRGRRDEDELRDCCDELRRKAEEWELLFGEVMLLMAEEARKRLSPDTFSAFWTCAKRLHPLLDLYVWEITDELLEKTLGETTSSTAVRARGWMRLVRGSVYNIRRPDAGYGIHTKPSPGRKKGETEAFFASLSFPDSYTLPAGAQLKTVFKYFLWRHRDVYSKSYMITLFTCYRHMAPLHEKPYRLIRPEHITACMKGLSDIARYRVARLYRLLDKLAFEKDLIPKRYAQGMRQIRPQESSHLNEFSQGEIDALLLHAGEIEVDMTLVLLYTGLTTQEVFELTFDDVDRDYIYLPNGERRLYGRNIPIHPVIRQSLCHVLGFLRDRDSQNVKRERRSHGLLRMVYKATEEYCGRRHSTIQCRSSFGSRAREAGGSEGVVHYLLGTDECHLRGCQQVYIHPSAERVYQVVMSMK